MPLFFTSLENLGEAYLMNVYAISGLGADERVFQFLDLNYDLKHIKWIPPIDINESLTSYVNRISTQIDKKHPFVILAVSFGGLIAVEISKILNPRKLILISSVDNDEGIRPVFKVFKHIVKCIPSKLLIPNIYVASIFFGTKRKKLLEMIIKDSDMNFNKWAIIQLLNWSSSISPQNSIKINGDKDLLIPAQKDDRTIIINQGAHFMIVDKAKEVSKLINIELFKLN